MRLVLPLCFLLFGYIVFGQPNIKSNPFVKNFSKTETKSGTQNWAIAQDNDGFMFFANNDGLLSYDGKKWNLNKISKTAPLRSIYIDKKNQIFVGLINDFGIVKKKETANLSMLV